MRKLMLPLAVLCILAFSSEAFAQCGMCQRCPVRKIVASQPLRKTADVVRGVGKGVGAVVKIAAVQPLQKTANAVRGVGKGVGAVVKGVAGRVECRQDRRQTRRCCR